MDIIAANGTLMLGLALVLGVFMTWGIGANDVANAMGTSVGSGAITVTTAVIIAAIFEFAGAAIAGGHVTATVRRNIVDSAMFTNTPEILVLGMLAALFSAAVWLLVASARGWPVSTTHSIVGALIGFALVSAGTTAVNWPKVGQIAASWVISPLVGGAIAFALKVSVRKLILTGDDPVACARRYGPAYVFLLGFVVSLVTLFKGLKHLKLELSIEGSFLIASLIGVLAAVLGQYLIARVHTTESQDRDVALMNVERIFTPMMLFAACAMAFAHGSNDVANGIGPLAAVYGIVGAGGEIANKSALPLWVLLLGGGGIVAGLATYGYRVMETIGTRITALTPNRGFCATLAAAATVVLASRTGLPVSTTHIAVGAVMGVGLARSVDEVDLRLFRDIVVSWVVTLPLAGGLAALAFIVLRTLFGA